MNTISIQELRVRTQCSHMSFVVIGNGIIFYSFSLSTADSESAVVSYWQKNVRSRERV